MSHGSSAGPDGLLLVDKPGGITSHDVVGIIRRRLSTRKVGHAGTLDPMATGLLVLGVGRATRLLRYLSGLDKTYVGSAVLGTTTDTLDADGVITQERNPADVSSEALTQAASAFVGEIQQVPPVYSAIKVAGQPLYKAARRGEEVEVPPRMVTIASFDVSARLPSFDFMVSCSSGTYVRTLVADLGEALGCGAHLTSLRRTKVGPFALADAVDPEEMTQPLPLERAVAHLPRVDLSEDEAMAARFGRVLGPSGIVGPYGVYDTSGALVGMYEDAGTKAVPQMILAPAE